MKNHKISLALAFLESQPTSAAAVLENQSLDQVADFLCNVPHKQGALVLQNMLPHYVAKIFTYMEPHIAASFLPQVDISHAAAILRYSDHSTNKAILKHLSERTRLACNLLLNYREDAVGAWMVTNIKTVPEECSVQDALVRLAASEATADMDLIYIVNREYRLLGSISTLLLLRSSPHSLVKTLMTHNPDAISGRSSLIAASNNPVWQKQDTVAVINKNRKLLGVLRHLDLRTGLTRKLTTRNQPKVNDPITGVIEVYGKSLLALFNALADTSNLRKR